MELTTTASEAQSTGVTALSTVMSVAGLTLRVVVGAYGLSLVGFLILRSTVGERWGYIALFNTYAHMLVVPSLALLPICLMLRRWGLSATLLPAALACIVWYGPFFWPNSIAPAGDDPTLTLLTFNIASYTGDYDTKMTLLREVNADIVTLQEVSPDLATRLNEEMTDVYPYRLIYSTDFVLGVAILSRYPLTNGTSSEGEVNYQRVEVDVNGTSIVLYNAHIRYPFVRGGFGRHAHETQVLLGLLRAETRPVIVAGDFNMSDLGEDYAHITDYYNDAFRTAGNGLGFTYQPRRLGLGTRRIPLGRNVPLARIDYIFHDEAFRALNARTLGAAAGSDHRPVWAQLVIVHNN